MQYQQSFGAETKCTPIQCKNGPLQTRKCTDFLCVIIYFVLIGVLVTFAIFSSNALKLSRSQLQEQLLKSEYGAPFVALTHSYFEICLALLCVVALCLVMIIITFIIPVLVTYIFIPIALFLILIIGSAFIYVYFGNTLPFLSPQNQNKYIQKKSLLALGIGILLLVTFGFILFVMITKRLRLSKIVNVLKIARVFFWQNIYTLFVSFCLTILSLVIWYLNILFLQISQDYKDSQHLIDSRIMTLIIIVQILWTHGLMEGLSDFLFEAFAINWYFNRAKYGQNYSKIGRNCCASLGMAFKHFGTIAFGWILAYMPEQINAIMRRYEQNCTCCYNFCCFCHKITIRKFSKYGYCQTILQSHSLCEANQQMFELKKRTKSTLPQLYTEGNFFMTICKTLILMFSLLIVYFLLIQQNQQFYFKNVFNLLIPMIVTLFASSEICNHFINVTGLVGDTIVFMYTVDIQIQKKNYGATQPYSCPEEVREIITQSRNMDIAYQY